jgi:hypothetical protein
MGSIARIPVAVVSGKVKMILHMLLFLSLIYQPTHGYIEMRAVDDASGNVLEIYAGGNWSCWFKDGTLFAEGKCERYERTLNSFRALDTSAPQTLNAAEYPGRRSALVKDGRRSIRIEDRY